MSNDDTQRQTRAHVWIQNFLNSDIETLRELGHNFDYLLDHADDWEAGNIGLGDLPELDQTEQFLQMRCIGFGCHMAADDAMLYLVQDESGLLAGVFGTSAHANARVDDGSELTVTEMTVNTPDIHKTLDPFTSHGDTFEMIAETFEYIIENWETFRSGNLSPDDFPYFDQNMKWFIAYNILFGMLWEYSYPSLNGVFTTEGTIDSLHWARRDADARASELGEDARVERLSVVDGDLGPDDLENVLDSQP